MSKKSKKTAEKVAENTSENSQENKAQPTFRCVGQYVKDLSFECVLPPLFHQEGRQNLDFQFNMQSFRSEQDENLIECVLSFKGKAMPENGSQTLFLAELDYAGLFVLQNVPDHQTELLLNVDAPALLFPFARSVFTQVIADSGYRPPLLEPINFYALYEHNKRENQPS